MLHEHTYFDDGLSIASTTELTADSISADNIEYSSFNAHGLPRKRRVHGCMWCQTEIRSNSRVKTHSPGHEEVVNTTYN